MSDANTEFVSVAEAAALERTPKTSIYRWIASKAVASHKNGGMTVVSLADVQRAAAARRTGGFPAITGNPPEKAPDNGKVETSEKVGAEHQHPVGRHPLQGAAGTKALNGEHQALALERFQQGLGPVEVAIEAKFDIDTLTELYGKFKKVRAESGTVTPLAEQVSSLQRWAKCVEDERLDPMGVDLYQLKIDHGELVKGIRNIVMARLETLERGQAHLNECIKQLNQHLLELQFALDDLQSPLRLLPP